MHISIFILVINQLEAQTLFHNKFTSCLYMFRASCAHRQEVKIVLYSLWYHHTCRWPSRAAASYASGRTACCSAPNSRPPTTKALHTICGNNTSIVSSYCWWAYKCPKNVEQIIIAIKHSVASSWFSSLRLYNDARTNIHQTP